MRRLLFSTVWALLLVTACDNRLDDARAEALWSHVSPSEIEYLGTLPTYDAARCYEELLLNFSDEDKRHDWATSASATSKCAMTGQLRQRSGAFNHASACLFADLQASQPLAIRTITLHRLLVVAWHMRQNTLDFAGHHWYRSVLARYFAALRMYFTPQERALLGYKGELPKLEEFRKRKDD